MTLHTNKAFKTMLLILAFGSLTAQAQIDFSVLDKYRGLENQRPSDWNSRPEKPQARKTQEQKPLSRAEKKAFETRQKNISAQKRQTKRELARLSKDLLVQVPQPTFEIAPKGSDLFGIQTDNGKRPFGEVMALAVAGVGTPANRIPTVNLRRAAAILAPLTTENMSEEDMSFLASQSALAMEGAPLAVVVRDVTTGSETRVRQWVQQSQGLEPLRGEAERASAAVRDIEKDLARVQNQISSGQGDAESLRKERESLLMPYQSAYFKAREKQEAFRLTAGRVIYVQEPKAPE
jgi:F0F1-type ATP synthase membrane subunit b/b'